MSSLPDFTSRFEIDDLTRIVTVSLTGNLDPAAVDDLHPQVQELVHAGFHHFVFDLSALNHVGSLGLRLMVGLQNQVKDRGAVVLCALSATTTSIVQLTKVNRVLRTYRTRVQAVDAIKNA